MNCPYCNNEMELANNPTEYFCLRVPFTEIEIRAIDFGRKEWVCLECYTEKHDEPYRAAFDAGMEVGYEKAREDTRYR